MIREELLEQINTRPASAEADALDLLPADVRKVVKQTHGCQRVLTQIRKQLDAIDAELMFLGAFSETVKPHHRERVEHLYEQRDWTRTDFDALYELYFYLTENLSVDQHDRSEQNIETERMPA